MKKLGILVMPLMAISLLASCGGSNPKPSPELTYYTVTLDAVEGNFNGISSLVLEVPTNEKLLPYIKSCIIPTAKDKTFAYYEYAEKDNAIDYDDIVTSDVTLKANYFPSSTAPTDDLTEFNWKTIKNIAVTGDPSLWFKIGATKKVEINEKDHLVRIIDFNHDKNPEGNNLGITFEFANVITNSKGVAIVKEWNKEQEDQSKNYDYRESTLNNFLNNEILNMLPSSGNPNSPDLKEAIKPVDKKVGVSTDEGQSYTAASFDGSEDYPYPYLFSLAHNEIADNGSWVAEGEGSKYQYYKDHSSDGDRIKRKASIDSGNGEYYWLRSPYTDFSSYAWNVYSDGYLNYGNFVYYYAFAVAPAFCI